MKFLLKAVLILSVAVLSAVASVQAVMAEDYFYEDFESPDRVYNVTAGSTPFGAEYPTFAMANSIAVTTANPDGNGSVLKLFPGASGTINMDMCTNDAGIKEGRVSLSMDMYLPKKLTDYDIINIQSVSGTQYELIALTNKTTAANSNAAVSNYPVGKWFTIKWTWDYNQSLASVSMIKEGQEYTIRTFDITKFAEGLSKCRIQLQRLGIEDIELYVDNLRYAPDEMENYPTKEKVWYQEDFHTTGVTYSMKVNKANYGSLLTGISGGASAVTTYCDDLAKNAMLLNVPAGATMNLENMCKFPKRVTGIQALDIKMYIPNGQLEGTTDKVFVFLRDGAGGMGPQINLIGPNNGDTVGTNLAKFNTPAVIGEEFTLRVIFNYPAQRYAAYIIKNDGTVSYRAQAALGSTMKTNGMGLFRITPMGNKAINMYVSGIKYYESNNMPGSLTFDNGDYTAGTAYTHNYADVNMTVGIGGGVAGVTAEKDPTDEKNTAIRYMQNAASALDGNACRLDTLLYTMTAGEDIVVMSADVYLPKALEASEHLCLVPYCMTDANNTLDVPLRSIVKLNGNLAGYSGQNTVLESGVAYPVGEWFTLRITFFAKSGYVRADLVRANGSVEKIMGDVLTKAKRTALNTYGMRKMRVIYSRNAQSVLEDPQGIYFDNLKTAALTFKDASLTYDDWDNCYIGNINYEAKGDVSLETQLIMAAYNAQDGKYVDCEIFTPPAFYNGEHSIEANMSANADIDMKMLLWDNISGMRPLITVEK